MAVCRSFSAFICLCSDVCSSLQSRRAQESSAPLLQLAAAQLWTRTAAFRVQTQFGSTQMSPFPEDRRKIISQHLCFSHSSSICFQQLRFQLCSMKTTFSCSFLKTSRTNLCTDRPPPVGAAGSHIPQVRYRCNRPNSAPPTLPPGTEPRAALELPTPPVLPGVFL